MWTMRPDFELNKRPQLVNGQLYRPSTGVIDEANLASYEPSPRLLGRALTQRIGSSGSERRCIPTGTRASMSGFGYSSWLLDEGIPLTVAGRDWVVGERDVSWVEVLKSWSRLWTWVEDKLVKQSPTWNSQTAFNESFHLNAWVIRMVRILSSSLLIIEVK